MSFILKVKLPQTLFSACLEVFPDAAMGCFIFFANLQRFAFFALVRKKLAILTPSCENLQIFANLTLQVSYLQVWHYVWTREGKRLSSPS